MVLREVNDAFETLGVPRNIYMNLGEVSKIISSQKGGKILFYKLKGQKYTLNS